MRSAYVGRSSCIEIFIFLCDENKNVLSMFSLKECFLFIKPFSFYKHFI